MSQAARVLALAPLAAFGLGCHIEEPFARDNHWDSRGTSVKTIGGPDSTFSIGDTIEVTLTGDPPLPPGQLTVEWSSIGVTDTAVQVAPAGYGRFVVLRAHAQYQPVPLAVSFHRNVVGYTIWVGQKIASFDVFCGTSVAPVGCDATPLAVGQNRTVNSTMFDAYTNVIRRRHGIMARTAIVVRDPTIATVPPQQNPQGAWLVFGTAPGATWIVFTADGVRDSVRLLVGP